ncbi:MAG: BcII family subclass B1 metallo-beta-lactamase [Rhodothermales bacterium]
MRLFAFALLFCLVSPVFGQRLGAPTHRVTDDLTVRAIGKGLYLHTTHRDLSGYPRFPSNGLIVISEGEALLIDTAWGEAETDSLITWIEARLGATVKRAIVTHAHDDRMSGMSVLQERGITTYGLPHTAELGAAQGWPSPDVALAGITDVKVGSQTVEVFFPGPGHTADNVVVGLPDGKLLFGGCLIRPAASKSLGNTADAMLDEWANSVARVQARYPDVRTVIPSHGPIGDRTLLEHTIQLIKQHISDQPGG